MLLSSSLLVVASPSFCFGRPQGERGRGAGAYTRAKATHSASASASRWVDTGVGAIPGIVQGSRCTALHRELGAKLPEIYTRRE